MNNPSNVPAGQQLVDFQRAMHMPPDFDVCKLPEAWRKYFITCEIKAYVAWIQAPIVPDDESEEILF